MCDAIRVGCIGLLCLSSSLAALGQTNANLRLLIPSLFSKLEPQLRD